MPQTRRLLGAASVEVASRKRLCHRNRRQHSVPKGGACLVVKNADGGSKNYCPECALAILDQAADDLQSLRDQLS